MSTDTPLDLEGPAAPPRRNGELVFEELWQGRAFGLAVALHEQGLYAWDEFRGRLIDAIAEDEQDVYYERWLAAFERLLLERGLLSAAEIEAAEQRVAEHDAHEHDGHEHDHHH